jgi:hypothetical protein
MPPVGGRRLRPSMPVCTTLSGTRQGSNYLDPGSTASEKPHHAAFSSPLSSISRSRSLARSADKAGESSSFASLCGLSSSSRSDVRSFKFPPVFSWMGPGAELETPGVSRSCRPPRRDPSRLAPGRDRHFRERLNRVVGNPHVSPAEQGSGRQSLTIEGGGLHEDCAEFAQAGSYQ